MTAESESRINEFLRRHGVRNNIIKGYGMTELSSSVFIIKDNHHNKIGSCGTPLIKNRIKIVSPESNRSLPYNEVGEIYATGPSVMKGYSNNPKAQAKVMVTDEYGEVWIRTGDLGQVDTNGNIAIVGRIKNMIIRPDGHNVYPLAIENVILKHEAIDKCVVVGVASRTYSNGKIPTACIY